MIDHLPPLYLTPNDVPVPLRHTLAHAHATGLTVHDLSLIFELPESWIELFVRPYEGHA